jgi:hypothetical protein
MAGRGLERGRSPHRSHHRWRRLQPRRGTGRRCSGRGRQRNR